MRRLLPILLLTLAVLLGGARVSWSQDFQKGLTAYQSGDYTTALREWTALAEQGDARAQYNVGAMNNNGTGVPQDFKTAVKWFKLAAEQGRADAQSNLGVLYEMGFGIPKDLKTAVKLYRLAAEQGNAQGQASLGAKYALGQGVLKDLVRGDMWLIIAESNGSKQATTDRDIVTGWMTPSQLEKAQNLARECVRKKYKGC